MSIPREAHRPPTGQRRNIVPHFQPKDSCLVSLPLAEWLMAKRHIYIIIIILLQSGKIFGAFGCWTFISLFLSIVTLTDDEVQGTNAGQLDGGKAYEDCGWDIWYLKNEKK